MSLTLAALMAGEMINTHRQIGSRGHGGALSVLDRVVLSFLGVQGASRFVALLSNRPGRSAPTF